MTWTFMYNHASCNQCKQLQMDAILKASAENRDSAGYASGDHGAIATRKTTEVK